MASTTVRITETSRDTLRLLSKFEGRAMQAVLDDAVEAYRRQKFLQDFNAAYALLREKKEQSETLQRELETWEVTLNDGLEEE